jgi:hypothetical protein
MRRSWARAVRQNYRSGPSASSSANVELSENVRPGRVGVSDQISDRDVVGRAGRAGTAGAGQHDRRGRTETNRTSMHVRTVALCAHNPEVAGSNPAPATNVVAGQRPFPIGRGPLACVARDQIRDQIADQRRLSRPTPSPAERRFEICATCCDGSGHLRRGRRV